MKIYRKFLKNIRATMNNYIPDPFTKINILLKHFNNIFKLSKLS